MKKREFNLSKKVKAMIYNEKYYIKYNRGIRSKIKYEENYHHVVSDPDGKRRNLALEKNYKLKQITYVLNYLKKIKPSKILDIGCGHGWLLSSLSNNWDKHGVEISKFASINASEHAKVFLGNIDNFKGSGFDIITALHVIEHHRKPENLIKKIYKILKPGGTLILETPDFDSAAARRYGKKFRLLHDKTHISLFSQDSLIRFVRKNKFKIFNINYPYFETPFFTKKNILKIFSKNKISPPFYGSVITLFCTKQ